MLFLMLAAQQAFGVRVGQPAAVFRDADGHDLKLLFVDGFDDRCCREQRDFVLATASAEYDSDPHFRHEERIAATSNKTRFRQRWSEALPGNHKAADCHSSEEDTEMPTLVIGQESSTDKT